mmetsp:Transcript_27313/g.40321  ORF Transcript_27313/g.40321 Transcript_27313/m.40321 type:complete len:183 (+) Transcript_27313:86-634(+)
MTFMNSSFTLRPQTAPQNGSEDAQPSSTSIPPAANPISLEGGIRLDLEALSHLSLCRNIAFFRPGSNSFEANSFLPITREESSSPGCRRNIVSPVDLEMMARDDTEDFALWEGERDDVSPRKVLFRPGNSDDEHDERMQDSNKSQPTSPNNSRKRKSLFDDEDESNNENKDDSGDMQRRRIQ